MVIVGENLEGEFAAFRAAGESASLLDAALLVARDAEPGLDAAGVHARVDALAESASAYVNAEAPLDSRADGLCRYLYGICGFQGAREDYYRYENSLLHRVLETRRGIPITLAVVYVSVAERLGMDCEGVNFPGHFLVRAQARTGGEGGCLIDPFVGHTISREECEARLQRAGGASFRVRDEHLRRAAPQDVLVRMLSNLKQLAFAEADPVRALHYTERLLWARPDALLEHRDRALLLEQLGRYEEAADALEQLAAGLRDGELSARLRAHVEALRLRARTPPTLH